ncbi:MAG: hypothetical protein M1828_003548 [Chrysothrix sp. TS-e1954]|nr:MAG: hypothetical protein M1828_003548 [Chrysothrix sp. TS-e1954]
MATKTLEVPKSGATSGSTSPRRLSANKAAEEALGSLRAATVVVPASRRPSIEGDASLVASTIELARRQLEGLTTADIAPKIPEKPTVTDAFTFAFDIDGVLIKGGKPIPKAIEAMKMLNGQNNRGIKVPYIFVTNGGGKTEAERCIQLSNQLEMEVSPGQFICGHTPMREMVETYKTVLVIGGEGEKCREVAEGYGFRDVVTPGDVIKTVHDTTPFRKLTEEELANSRVRDFANMKVEAIFVFADSRDWAGDQQIILDFLTSKNGVLGTRSENYDEGPPLYFAHNDVVWATSHGSSRIGMGALRKSVEAMFEAVTGKELESVAFGKPQIGTFEYATKLLQQWRKDTHGIDAPPQTVYFVGDTPESDIRGTNNFNEKVKETWYSILVRTGVFREGTQPKFKPMVTVDDVLGAVKHGIERELKKELARELQNSKTPLIEVPNAEI